MTEVRTEAPSQAEQAAQQRRIEQERFRQQALAEQRRVERAEAEQRRAQIEARAEAVRAEAARLEAAQEDPEGQQSQNVTGNDTMRNRLLGRLPFLSSDPDHNPDSEANARETETGSQSVGMRGNVGRWTEAQETPDDPFGIEEPASDDASFARFVLDTLARVAPKGEEGPQFTEWMPPPPITLADSAVTFAYNVAEVVPKTFTGIFDMFAGMSVRTEAARELGWEHPRLTEKVDRDIDSFLYSSGIMVDPKAAYYGEMLGNVLTLAMPAKGPGSLSFVAQLNQSRRIATAASLADDVPRVLNALPGAGVMGRLPSVEIGRQGMSATVLPNGRLATSDPLARVPSIIDATTPPLPGPDAQSLQYLYRVPGYRNGQESLLFSARTTERVADNALTLQAQARFGPTATPGLDDIGMVDLSNDLLGPRSDLMGLGRPIRLNIQYDDAGLLSYFDRSVVVGMTSNTSGPRTGMVTNAIGQIREGVPINAFGVDDLATRVSNPDVAAYLRKRALESGRDASELAVVEYSFPFGGQDSKSIYMLVGAREGEATDTMIGALRNASGPQRADFIESRFLNGFSPHVSSPESLVSFQAKLDDLVASPMNLGEATDSMLDYYYQMYHVRIGKGANCTLGYSLCDTALASRGVVRPLFAEGTAPDLPALVLPRDRWIGEFAPGIFDGPPTLVFDPAQIRFVSGQPATQLTDLFWLLPAVNAADNRAEPMPGGGR